MFRFLAKTAIASVIWKRYRRMIVSTLVMFAGFFLISQLHSDFVQYAKEVEEKQLLAWAYLAKWAGFGLVFGGYYFFNFPPSWLHRQAGTLQEQKGFGGRSLEESSASGSQNTDSTAGSNQTTDAFAAIRHKPKLRGRGDLNLK